MPKSKGERLDAILAKVHPEARAKDGTWTAGAPYVIDGPGGPGLPAGARRVRVISADGDSVAGVGDSVETAIAALERKVGLVDTKGQK